MVKMGFVVAACLLFFMVTIVLKNASASETDIPRPEHPRPDFQRELWLNLNGRWEFDFDPQNIGVNEKWFQKKHHSFSKQIVVPFPWESSLSGIHDISYGGVAWYQRSFEIPRTWRKKRIILKFGGVDWEAMIWVNGQKVGEHHGGYSPFEFDITDFVKTDTENIVTVRVFDETDPEMPVGKQVGWYTPTSGIWQTVHLEAHETAYIESIRFFPDIDASKVTLKLSLEAPARAKYSFKLTYEDREPKEITQKFSLKAGQNNLSLSWSIEQPKLWSPDQPHLYFARMALLKDKTELDAVKTYFGMRKIHTAKYGDHPFEYIFLNNKPIYLMGALNQAFNPEGIYTYPSDEYIRADLERTKEFGFNFLRIHIKVDEPRFYYWADKLGVLIMSDMPCFRKYSERAQKNWEGTFRDAVARDFNHPSIISWCLFNETWGLNEPGEYSAERQEWVRAMVRLARQLDPTRLIEDNSPCRYDHVETDINSWHFYINSYWRAKYHIDWIDRNTYPGSHHNYIGENRQTSVPLINSEYGGISAGLGDQDISCCLKYLTNELRLHSKIGGYIYTELQDIEWEHNGMMDYDRQPKTFGYEHLMPDFSYRDINNLDFIAIDKEPCARYQPGDEFSAEIFSSHYSDKQFEKTILYWKCTGYDGMGHYKDWLAGCQPIPFKQYTVEKVFTLIFTLPDERFLGTIAVWIEDEKGEVVARNYSNVHVYDRPSENVEILSDETVLLRFNPGDYVKADWDSLIHPAESRGQKVSGTGTGFFLYRLSIPDKIDPATLSSVDLLFEGAARAGHAKVDARFPGARWSRKKPIDYPQTDTSQYPTDVTISINDMEISTIHFEDDPADARGVLSHALEFESGSYGYLTELKIPADKLNILKTKWQKERYMTIKFQVKEDAKNKGGFGLFGEMAGRYPVMPVMILKRR